MKRFLVFLLAAVFVAGCQEQATQTVAPEGADAQAARGGQQGAPPDNAALEGQINKLLQELFPEPEKRAAHKLFAEIKDALDDGDTQAAQAAAFDLLQLALQTDLNDPPGPTTTDEALQELADLLFEFVGLDVPTIADDDDGTIALALDGQDNLILTEEKFAGTFIPDEALSEDLIIVIERLTEDEQDDLPGGECLPTDLEQEEGCYQFDRFPEGVFDDLVEVGVCYAGTSDDFQLHRFSTPAEGVVALPNIAFPELECDDFTVVRGPGASTPWRLARSAWGATGGELLSWLGPTPLKAVDSGVGGSTDDFSRIGWARALDVDIEEGDGQTAQPGSQVSTDPTVKVTHLPESDNDDPVEGAEVTFTVVKGNGTVGNGQTSVTVTTDSDGLASTSWTLGDPGDNELEASVPDETVTFTATAALPDLVVSSGTPTVTPTTVLSGESVDLSDWDITNQGSGDVVTQDGTIRNGFYLSTDATLTPADVLLGQNNNTDGVLEAGETFNWGGPTLTVPSGTTPGDYFIGILVDDLDEANESDETNNFVSTPLTVAIGGAGTAQVDGVISSGEWDGAGCVTFDADLPEGGTTPVTWCVMNDGANVYSRISFPRSGDPQSLSGVEFDQDGDEVLGIDPGDDLILIQQTNSDPFFRDEFVLSDGSTTSDAQLAGGTVDGAGDFTNDGTTSVYEFSHPLSSGDSHDISVAGGSVMDLQAIVSIRETVGGTPEVTRFPAFDDGLPWLVVSVIQ